MLTLFAPSARPGVVASARRPPRAAAVVGALLVLAIMIGASIAIGAKSIPLDTVWTAVSGGSVSGGSVSAADAAVIVDQRLPRTVLGLAAGAALGVAGALVQAVTRNPLADPGLLGVTGGSAFLVAIAMAFLGITAPIGYVWFAFLGALAAGAAVYAVGSAGRSGANHSQLVLAGAALTAVLSGVVSAIRLSNPQRFNNLLVWESGSFQGRGWDVIAPVLPFIALGLALAFAVAGKLNMLALGDDLAISLGTSPVRVRVLALAAITLLAGGATAMAGPIAFIGLMIAQVARWIVGPDQRWIIALTALVAPSLLIGADVVGRVVARPGEVPVGIVTALIGAPVLIALVRRKRVSGL